MASQVTAMPRDTDREDVPLDRLLAPLITREIAAIAALDAAIAAEERPDYVVMFQATKTGKQANVEQMATLIRRAGGIPPERGGLRRHLLKSQSAVVERVAGTTATLLAMRADEAGLLRRYTHAMEHADALGKASLRKALTRALVHGHLLTAHIAKRTGSDREAACLPQPLQSYFAGPVAKACMRCHLDRPGTRPALERSDPAPYTYICAGCHVDVRGEFSPDLAAQIDRWPPHVQHARVLQHAIGRPSVLNAIHSVLHPLSGLTAEIPSRPEAKAVVMPALEPPPAPAPHERRGVLSTEPRSAGEAEYVAELFDFWSVRTSW